MNLKFAAVYSLEARYMYIIPGGCNPDLLLADITATPLGGTTPPVGILPLLDPGADNFDLCEGGRSPDPGIL